MLDNREVGRTLRRGDEVLQVLKGKTIADVSYSDSDSGTEEIIRITLDNGFVLVIESGESGHSTSYLSASIEKEDQ